MKHHFCIFPCYAADITDHYWFYVTDLYYPGRPLEEKARSSPVADSTLNLLVVRPPYTSRKTEKAGAQMSQLKKPVNDHFCFFLHIEEDHTFHYSWNGTGQQQDALTVHVSYQGLLKSVAALFHNGQPASQTTRLPCPSTGITTKQAQLRMNVMTCQMIYIDVQHSFATSCLFRLWFESCGDLYRSA